MPVLKLKTPASLTTVTERFSAFQLYSYMQEFYILDMILRGHAINATIKL